MEHRIHWIDILKGIGIISVVIAHVVTEGSVNRFIFLFHMPLFFYLSGYLYKPNPNYKQYFIQKFQALMIPYFAFLILFFVPQFGFRWPLSKPLDALVLFLWGGSEFKGWLGAFWFVTSFFITQQLFNWLFNNLTSKLLISLNIIFLVLAYLNYYYLPHLSIPLAANLVLYTLPIFTTGYYLKGQESKVNKVFQLILLLLIGLICYFYPLLAVGIKFAEYGVIGFSFILGIIVVIIFITVSKYLAEYKLVTSCLSFVGKCSMTIMFVHQAIQQFILQHLTSMFAIRIFAALAVSMFLHEVFRRFHFTRVIFLGSK